MHVSEIKAAVVRHNIFAASDPKLKDLGDKATLLAIPTIEEFNPVISKLSEGAIDYTSCNGAKYFVYDVIEKSWTVVSVVYFDENYKIVTANRGVFIVEKK